MINKPIYLDSAAGVKCYPEVIETITDILENHWGNASSDNSLGIDAKKIIRDSTQFVASDINCDPEEIIWTSCGCESNSLAIKGYLEKTNHYNNTYDFITTSIEHTSVEKIYESVLMKNKYTIPSKWIEQLSVNHNGIVDCNQLNELMKYNRSPAGTLVSISFANSEIGTIQDIKAISEIVHKNLGILHVDATQAYPWFKIDVKELGIDMMSVSGQKLGTPRGVGFLYVKDGIELATQIHGSQQNKRRGGTYPTHLVAAFSKALEITRSQCNDKVLMYRDYMISKLTALDDVQLNGSEDNRLPNNISIRIKGVNADKLVTLCSLFDIIIAKGSACKSHSPEPSKTLLAIGLSPEQALSTVRITLHHDLTYDDVVYATDIIIKMIERIREENN